MVQLKYAWKGLIKKPGRYIPLYVQMIVSVLLFSFIVKEFHTMNQFSRQLMSYTEHKNMYVSELRGDPVHIMNELFSEDGEQRCKELYEFILERGNVYIQMEVTAQIRNVSEGLLAVNEGFCNLYEINVKEGRMFSKDELAGILEDERIPVLVGEERTASFPVGTVFQGDVNGRTFQVIGIIDRSSFYLNPATKRAVSYFENRMVIPWLPDERLNGANGGYNDIDLFNLLQIETDQPEGLLEIKEKSKELNLFNLPFVSYEQRIANLDNYYKLIYERELAMLGAILLYCVVGSVTMLLHYIRSNIRQFSIHILCGAGKNDMIVRMIIQIGIPVVVAMLIITLLLQNELAFLAGLGFSVGMMVLIMIIPIQFWRRVQISQILKRYD